MIHRIEDDRFSAMKPLVSVGILVYNHEHVMRECLDSVLQQERDFEMEIILGDDGSTDGTARVCLEYQKRYPDVIKLLLSDSNQGIMKSFLMISRECRGEFLAQVSGDDYWTCPQKLQKQIGFLLDNPDYGAVYTDFDFYWHHNNTWGRNAFENKLIPRSQTFEDILINKRFLAPMTWVGRKEYNPINFDYSDKNYVDESFAILLDTFALTKFHYIPESTAVKRIIKGSVSNAYTLRERYDYLKGLFDMQKDYIHKYNLPEEIRTRVYSDNYFLLSSMADMLGDKEFLEEARLFFESQHVKSDHFFQHIQTLSGFHRKYIKFKGLQPKNWFKKKKGRV